MFPSHCKEVSFKAVNFDLTPENIKSYLKGKKAYIRTRYYVFNSGNRWAVALIVRRDGNGVLQDIASVHILSLPHETSYVEDPMLEVLSATAMGRLRETKGTKCVVVKGKAEHLSFFIDEPPYELAIFDVVPPSPSKLLGLVNTVLETDLQDRYVKVSYQSCDLLELAKDVNKHRIMFPCRASGLAKGVSAMFLDETPELSEDDLKDLTLVGCSLSARIFAAVYGREPMMINMCPVDLLKGRSISGPVLVKCCKVKEGFQVDGQIGKVPWGARASEVSAALRAILR
ncbi:MAG TPA: hypothetical protein VGB78_10890 [Thermoplasmata archaeon]